MGRRGARQVRSGSITDAARRGVSVFPDEEGRQSEDEDFDADEGALLVIPTRIVDARPVDENRLREAKAG